MQKFTEIPAGYRLSVTSWENDGDNYQTHTMSGLSEHDLIFNLKFAKLFADTSIGNQPYDPVHNTVAFIIGAAVIKLVSSMANGVPEKVRTAVDAAAVLNDSSIPDDEIDEDQLCLDVYNSVSSLVPALLGRSEHFDTRVFDSYKVEYVPEPIKILDVTDLFSQLV